MYFIIHRNFLLSGARGDRGAADIPGGISPPQKKERKGKLFRRFGRARNVSLLLLFLVPPFVPGRKEGWQQSKLGPVQIYSVLPSFLLSSFLSLLPPSHQRGSNICLFLPTEIKAILPPPDPIWGLLFFPEEKEGNWVFRRSTNDSWNGSSWCSGVSEDGMRSHISISFFSSLTCLGKRTLQQAIYTRAPLTAVGEMVSRERGFFFFFPNPPLPTQRMRQGGDSPLFKTRIKNLIK